ncbi:MAG: DNA repair protein RadC [Erysipelotrichaceae bacterium]|nr:DNA repair protein RadC [Erysipelotrichaceae bacterium]
MKIKERNKMQRPREKAAKYGIRVLSDEEILCLLLGSGQNNLLVDEIAQSVLAGSDNLSGLADLGFEELVKIRGVGPAKAWVLLAGMELTRRCYERKARKEENGSRRDLVQWLIMEYGTKKQEHLAAVFLNGRGKMISHKTLFIGTGTEAVIHPSHIIREACLAGAASVILVHNHPGGDLQPSDEDRQTTAVVQKALESAGLSLIDHLIVSGNGSFSFFGHRLLD